MTLQREIHASTIVSVEPTEYPLSPSEIREHLRFDDGAGDVGTITPMIRAATRYIEKHLSRSLITQTRILTLDDFPDEIELRYPPVQSVSSITYTDNDGATQTLATSVYAVDVKSSPPRITLKYNQSWPTYRSIESGILVTYVAGYGAASAVPETIKAAMKLLIAHWWSNRSASSEIEMHEIPMAVKSLLSIESWGGYE